jgi:hypothetical protein
MAKADGKVELRLDLGIDDDKLTEALVDVQRAHRAMNEATIDWVMTLGRLVGVLQGSPLDSVARAAQQEGGGPGATGEATEGSYVDVPIEGFPEHDGSGT